MVATQVTDYPAEIAIPVVILVEIPVVILVEIPAEIAILVAIPAEIVNPVGLVIVGLNCVLG